jgi:hypothetical protein
MRSRVAVSLSSLVGLSLALACSAGATPSDGVSPGDGVSPSEAVRPAFETAGRSGFGFNGSAGGPTGTVRLTGGGSFDAASASNTVPAVTSASSSGGFRCTTTVAQGPLAGCLSGQGVRWDTEQLLASTSFKCSASDAPIPFTTDDHAAALLADFYRAGDGNEESFRAQMIVADRDIAPGIPGVQNLWVQGVGCGTANVNFN